MKHQRLLQLLRDNAERKPRPLNVVRNDAASEATIYLYDVIDPWWGASAESMARAIADLSNVDTLHLHVNSPGGDVFEGRAMRSALQQFKGKTIGHIDGLAASAATTVVDACDEVLIAEGAFYMIHNGWTLGYGNRHELSKTVDLLQKVDAAIAADYAKRTGASLEQVAAWMDEETWFSSAEAVDNKFATGIAQPADKAAQATADNAARGWNLAAYDKAPRALLDRLQAPPPAPEPDWAACRAHNARRLRLHELA